MILYNPVKTDIRIGDPVVFDGEGILFKVLSFLLASIDVDYRRLNPKPWHVGFISRYDLDQGWMIYEATGNGVQENPLSIYDPEYYQIYHWFDEPLDVVKVNLWVDSHLGCKYDNLAYVWVTIATLANKVLGLNLGRWQNNSFMCWELLESFCEAMGKPFSKDYRTITISDIMRALKCA